MHTSFFTKAAIFLSAAVTSQAAVKLPAFFSDHMVLQRGMPVRIWGWADPGEAVRVEFQGQAATAKTAADGRWTAWLRPVITAGPSDLTVAAGNTIVIHDVLVGEVWIASGQSNMEFVTGNVTNHEQELAHANHPLIRLFHVTRAEADQPAADVKGSWQLCTADSVKSFSAVAYFFGRNLQDDLGVPIGLIDSTWGGTPAEAWISHPAIEADATLDSVFKEWDKVLADYPAAKERYDKQLATWEKAAADAKAQGKTPPNRPAAPRGPGNQWTPGGLYNGMIAPLVGFGIRGALWYQGESNANEAHAFVYRRLFGDMIEDWRNRWGEGDFPFYFVQLPNYKTSGWWPVLRESQQETLRLANTGMAVTIDIGDPGNIHPTNKQDVGWRLGLVARALTYHEALEYSGPVLQSITQEGGAMRLYFTHADGMRGRDGGAITGFEVAGSDGAYVAAEAHVDGSTVVVSSSTVAAPVAVRYAWADNPTCNLVNAWNLPAGPFRSDTPYYGK